ncbi:unnamed protein product [Urochloa humidicola]
MAPCREGAHIAHPPSPRLPPSPHPPDPECKGSPDLLRRAPATKISRATSSFSSWVSEIFASAAAGSDGCVLGPQWQDEPHCAAQAQDVAGSRQQAAAQDERASVCSRAKRWSSFRRRRLVFRSRSYYCSTNQQDYADEQDVVVHMGHGEYSDVTTCATFVHLFSTALGCKLLL